MTRRDLLRQIGVLLGGTVSHPVVAAVLGGAKAAGSEQTWRPRTLSPAEDRLVTAIAELIIPTTDTPGAAAARVNEFIDLLLTDWLDDDERERFLSGLRGFEATSRDRFGRPFLELTTEEQASLLEPLDEEAVEARIEAARMRRSREVGGLPFFGMMKEMTLVGYYTSEIGATEELRYDPYPGAYAGCEPLDDAGKTWADQ